MKTTYTHAAPYIRGQVLSAVSLKISARTKRDASEYGGQAHGLVSALRILLNSPEGANSPDGYPEYRGANKQRVLAELERFLGGPDKMTKLGFTELASYTLDESDQDTRVVRS